MTEDEKYLFDKVIQARYEHIHFYNHWMNMYAIFNGALFVCLYTLAKESKCWDKNLFLFLITVGVLVLFIFLIHKCCSEDLKKDNFPTFDITKSSVLLSD